MNSYVTFLTIDLIWERYDTTYVSTDVAWKAVTTTMTKYVNNKQNHKYSTHLENIYLNRKINK